jgi:hypothetical protein
MVAIRARNKAGRAARKRIRPGDADSGIESEDRGQRAEGRGRRAEGGGQRSGVRSQKSDVSGNRRRPGFLETTEYDGYADEGIFVGQRIFRLRVNASY